MRIVGAIQEHGKWRRRYNTEIYKLCDEIDWVNYIRINRLQWAGHVTLINDKQIPNRILLSRSEGK
jgi:hypothetical protein